MSCRLWHREDKSAHGPLLQPIKHTILSGRKRQEVGRGTPCQGMSHNTTQRPRHPTYGGSASTEFSEEGALPLLDLEEAADLLRQGTGSSRCCLRAEGMRQAPSQKQQRGQEAPSFVSLPLIQTPFNGRTSGRGGSGRAKWNVDAVRQNPSHLPSCQRTR